MAERKPVGSNEDPAQTSNIIQGISQLTARSQYTAWDTLKQFKKR